MSMCTEPRRPGTPSSCCPHSTWKVWTWWCTSGVTALCSRACRCVQGLSVTGHAELPALGRCRRLPFALVLKGNALSPCCLDPSFLPLPPCHSQGLLSRPDWAAARHLPFAHVPGGSGNGLAASCGLWDPVTAAYSIAKVRQLAFTLGLWHLQEVWGWPSP